MTKKTKFEKWVESLPAEKRLTHARQSLEGATNVAHFLVALHQTNQIVMYSDTLSSQIPYSYAGNAYNNFTRALFEAEFVRLCSLWDPAEQDAFSIPTIVDFIDDRQVIDLMARANGDHWRSLNLATRTLGLAEHDNEIRDIIREQYEHRAERVWREEYEQTILTAKNTIKRTRLIARSNVLENVKNFRNKHIAHATALTRLERDRANGPLPPPKVGDRHRLLHRTLKVLERLNFCVSGISLRWKDSEKIAKQSAEALWSGVTINVRC